MEVASRSNPIYYCNCIVWTSGHNLIIREFLTFSWLFQEKNCKSITMRVLWEKFHNNKCKNCGIENLAVVTRNHPCWGSSFSYLFITIPFVKCCNCLAGFLCVQPVAPANSRATEKDLNVRSWTQRRFFLVSQRIHQGLREIFCCV